MALVDNRLIIMDNGEATTGDNWIHYGVKRIAK